MHSLRGDPFRGPALLLDGRAAAAVVGSRARLVAVSGNVVAVVSGTRYPAVFRRTIRTLDQFGWLFASRVVVMVEVIIGLVLDFLAAVESARLRW